MTPDLWVTLIIGLGGGGTAVHAARLLLERRDGAGARHRAELDRAAAATAAERTARLEAEQQHRVELAAAEAAVEAAEAEEERRARRERMALEALSATRRVALDHGVPYDQLPPVDLGGR